MAEESSAEAAQRLAVERAVRDALVDRDLADHAAHLKEINGSQREMAASIAALKESFATIASFITDQARAHTATVTSRQLLISAAAVIAAIVIPILAVVLAKHP